MRVVRFEGVRPLCVADLRHIVRRLGELDYPDECLVEVVTPLPPRDRRVVDIIVRDRHSAPTNEKRTNQ